MTTDQAGSGGNVDTIIVIAMDALSRNTPAAGERSSIDDVVELYKRDVDRTLLRENLKLTPDERVRKMVAVARFAELVREAGRKAFGY
jgi:hypothetical protein